MRLELLGEDVGDHFWRFAVEQFAVTSVENLGGRPNVDLMMSSNVAQSLGEARAEVSKIVEAVKGVGRGAARQNG